MINSYELKNFKSFDSAKLAFTKLNILSGINGSGKSSVIQSLLLLKSYYEYQSSDYNIINLNNNYCQLGKVQDVFHEGAEDQKIELVLEIDKKDFLYSFDLDLEEFGLDYLQFENGIHKKSEVSEFFDNIHYLQANRMSPAVLQEKNDYKVRNLRDIGISGEFVYHYLNIFGKQSINIQERLHLNAVNSTLIENTIKWLQNICPNISLNTDYIDGTDLVGLNYSFERKLGISNNYRSTNVGFGISYVLPVIVQCLKAEKGDLLIIDTPEAHLHPQGQSKLGELFSKTASDGVQVIVETHSDHVINGIRKSVVTEFISPDDVNFYFFEMIDSENDISSHTNILSPKLDKNAKFDFWPDGFFDEWTKSLNQILRAQQ
ncbi:TPA: DUF3696 domain-containing protein [Morganella morganii]